MKNSVGILTITIAAVILIGFAAPFSSHQAGKHAVFGALAASFWVASSTGLGAALLKESSYPEAFAMGAGLLGLLLGMTSTVMGISLLTMSAIGMIGILSFARKPTITFHKAPPLLLLLLGVTVLFASIDALAPPVDTDEIYQHLALPHQFLIDGEIQGGALQPDASRPLPVHMLYTAMYGLGGAAGPKLFHLFLSITLLWALWEIAERRAGKGAGIPSVLLLIGSYTFLREMGLAYNNIPTALWCLLALDNALADRPRRMALFAGMALAAKYTSGPVVAGIFIAWMIQKKGLHIAQSIQWAGLSLLLVSFWWLLNLWNGHHALFPYLGWETEDIQFMMLDKYGMGRDWNDFLVLPWNLSIHADPSSNVFLGRVSPAGLILLPAGLLLAAKKHKAIWVCATAGLVGWAIGPHWLRYLLPAAPILALALTTGFVSLPRWARWAFYLAVLFGLPANWGPWLQDLGPKAPVAVGLQDKELLLKEQLRGYEAVHYINTYTPKNAKVALLFAWPKLHIDRSQVLGSVEDHVPSRVLLAQKGDQALQFLKQSGVSYLLVGGVCDDCSNFLKKSYPFLSEKDFQTQFRAPERLLSELLRKEATQVFESAKYSVWRIL